MPDLHREPCALPSPPTSLTSPFSRLRLLLTYKTSVKSSSSISATSYIILSHLTSHITTNTTKPGSCPSTASSVKTTFSLEEINVAGAGEGGISREERDVCAVNNAMVEVNLLSLYTHA
jgi:hypothetical protein